MPQTPEQLEALRVLQGRRESLTDNQRIAVDELSRRWGTAGETDTVTVQEDEQGRPWYLPGWRTALRTSGAIVGGGVGFAGGTVAGTPVAGVGGAAMGGAAGASIGESLYQILARLGVLEAEEPLPRTPGEAAMTHAGAMLEGTLQEGSGALISRVGGNTLRRGMQDATEEAIAPRGLAEKANAQKISGEFQSRLPLAATTRSLYEKVGAGARQASRQLDEAYDAIPADRKIGTQTIADGLRKNRGDLFIQGKQVPGTDAQLRAYDELIEFFGEVPEMSIGELRRNRQIWDSIVRYTRAPGASQPEREAVYQTAADLTRGIINRTSDDIARLNHEYHLWSTAENILEKASLRGVDQPLVTFRDAMAGAVGGVVGASTGVGAGVGTAIGIGARQLMSSTAWKTASVPLRRQALRVIENGGSLSRALGILTGKSGIGLMRATTDQ